MTKGNIMHKALNIEQLQERLKVTTQRLNRSLDAIDSTRMASFKKTQTILELERKVRRLEQSNATLKNMIPVGFLVS